MYTPFLIVTPYANQDPAYPRTKSQAKPAPINIAYTGSLDANTCLNLTNNPVIVWSRLNFVNLFIMATKGEILDFLTRNKEYFRDRYGVTKIGLFGSYVRDEQTSGSDIDLVVDFEKNTPNLYDIKREIKDFIKNTSI